MLVLKALNSDAQLNTFMDIGSLSFYGGEDVTVVLRLKDIDKNLRYIPEAGATYSITLKNSDGTDLVKTPTELFTEDRSIITFSITAAESLLVVSQNLKLEITEGASTKIALGTGIFQRTVDSSSC